LDGALLGKKFVLEEVSNLCFGGPKLNRLFITASTNTQTVLLPKTGALLF
jgi:gluconolactonase